MEIAEEDFFLDDLDVLEIIDVGFPRRHNVRSEVFETLDEHTFFRRFRLTKQTTLNLFDLIFHDLDYSSHSNNSISPMNRLLIFLRFAASGGHIDVVSDYMNMSISAASRIIARVSEILANLRMHFILMPQDAAEKNVIARGFYEIARFPRVVGCVDGSHVRILSPGGEDPEIFRNRKGYFSLNIQAVCDHELKIQDIVARWPGSQHDATIYNHSRICARFENNEFPQSILLGDSAYALTNYFLTPLLNPRTQAENLYNEAHIRTRNCVERLFGVWKRRFPVLAYGLRIKLETVLALIVATAVLHNIAILSKEEEPPAAEGIDVDELELLINQGQVDALDNPVFEQGADNPILFNTRNAVVAYFAGLLNE